MAAPTPSRRRRASRVHRLRQVEPDVDTSNALLLTVRPDSLATGSAPADPYLTGKSCGPGFVPRACVSAASRSTRRCSPASLAVAGTANLGAASPRSRNVVGHLFLGSPVSGFGDVATSGDVDPDLGLARARGPCEVPLALFYLQGSSVVQLDEWAVRRPCRAATDDAVGLGRVHVRVPFGCRVATYLQFQAQLADLLGDGRAAGPAGRDAIPLPARGRHPAVGVHRQPRDRGRFLATRAAVLRRRCRPRHGGGAERPIKSARVETMVRDGTRLPPVDVRHHARSAA